MLSLKFPLALAVLFLVGGLAALSATTKEKHPSYVQALADLSEARTLVEKQLHDKPQPNLTGALDSIDQAIAQTRIAAGHDKKKTSAQAVAGKSSKQHWNKQTLTLLEKARADIRQAEGHQPSKAQEKAVDAIGQAIAKLEVQGKKAKA